MHVLSGLDNAYGGNGHSAVVVRADDVHAADLDGPGGAVDRSGAGGKGSAELAIPLAADRRLAGILRRRHAEEHELGGCRTGRCRRRRFRTACSTACSAQRQGWVKRQAEHTGRRARQERAASATACRKKIELRLDEHLSSIRDLERAIASLPPDYQNVTSRSEDFDMKDWPRVAKLQSDLLAYAFATGQTRVASYMLTKCQGLARFPWLGHTAARHHDYTHKDGKAPGERAQKDSGSCGTSAAGTSKSSPIWWRSSSPFRKATAPCSTTLC